MPPVTPSQTIGPFFAHALPFEDGGRVMRTESPARITIDIVVTDGAGEPVPDALVESWQADETGRYAHPHDAGAATADRFDGFGRVATDAGGRATIVTVKPGRTRAPHQQQAPHIALTVFARGLLTHLLTRIYFEDDPPAADDPVFACVPPERRHTLLARRDGAARYRFAIVLQGERETVFFDL